MRICNITNEVMTCGWVTNDCDMYFKYKRDAIDWCRANGYQDLADAHSDGALYWTDWGNEFYDWRDEFDALSDGRFYLSNEETIELIESRHTPKSAVQMLIDNPKYLIK